MEKALDCKIIVNKFDEEGNIIGFSVLSSEDAINLTADNKNITEKIINTQYQTFRFRKVFFYSIGKFLGKS